MTLYQYILMGFLIICAISVSFSKKLLNSILIYMSYSLIMSILWVCLESPDLAITEAAVGAGVTSILFFATLKKIQAIRIEQELSVKENMQSSAKTALEPAGANSHFASGIESQNDQITDQPVKEAKQHE